MTEKRQPLPQDRGERDSPPRLIEGNTSVTVSLAHDDWLRITKAVRELAEVQRSLGWANSAASITALGETLRESVAYAVDQTEGDPT